MMRQQMVNLKKGWWGFWVTTLTVGLVLLVLSSAVNEPGTVRAEDGSKMRVIVYNDPVTGQPPASLATSKDASLLADYGSFGLWALPAEIARRNNLSISHEFDTIELRGGTVLPTARNTLQLPSAKAEQFWLVQFIGPIKPEWVAKLTQANLQIVTYLPHNAYVVWLPDVPQSSKQATLIFNQPEINWAGEYKPAYRLAPDLSQTSIQNPAEPVTVTVQIYNTSSTAATLSRLTSLSQKIVKKPSSLLNLTDVTLQLRRVDLPLVASYPDVFNVESWQPPVRRDEIQNQIIAGNILTSDNKRIPNGPGYLAWLSSKGFPLTPGSYPLVDVVDDGVDNGTTTPLHPDFHQNGISGTNTSRLLSVQNCTADSQADGAGGHGNLNAGIIAGFNNRTGSPYRDVGNYLVGLGVSPYGRIRNTKVYDNFGIYDITNCGNTDAAIVRRTYEAGAIITANGWGTASSGNYNATARAYDILTRDASAIVTGNQQILHIFAAGNSGPGSGTLDSPASAKNVLTVGATENVRDEGIADGCRYTNADNADDLASFSARGPTADGRIKPEIVAPGIHVQAQASQSDAFATSGSVCGGPNNFVPGTDPYYPANQTLYTWSSGTSVATAGVAGAVSLIYNYYGRVWQQNATPSPAMAKALLLSTPRYLNGQNTGGTLPSPAQGWGGPDLNRLFEGTPRILLDQTTILTATGQTFTLAANVVSATQPVRVVLVWTDAPGATVGSSYVNNLDLEVSLGGQTYRGNVFNGAVSASGNVADSKNNVEAVYLPAGISGSMVVRVRATNLPGDGVPANEFNLDQDFALVVYNASPANSLVLLEQVGYNTVGGNGNGVIEPGETHNLAIGIKNNGDAATTVSGQLTTTTPGVTIISGTANYGSLVAGATLTNTSVPYRIAVSPNLSCGTPLVFTHTLTYGNGETTSFPLQINAGTLIAGSATQYFTSTDVPKNIPDFNPIGVNSSLVITSPDRIGKIRVSVNISHTYTEDLIIKLVAPDQTAILLSNRRGSDGDGYLNTTFDDAAPVSVISGTAPFTGSYRPEQLLAGLIGRPLSGTWQLVVSDKYEGDVGQILSWSLAIEPQVFLCQPNNPSQVLVISGTPQSTAVGEPFSVPLGLEVRDTTGNPIQSVVVTFSAPLSGPTAIFNNGQSVITGTTNLDGRVFASLAANGQVGSYQVEARVTGYVPTLAFSLTNLSGLPAQLTVVSGSGQSAPVDTAFEVPLTIRLTDKFSNPISGSSIIFNLPNTGSGVGAGATFGGMGTLSFIALTSITGTATSPYIRANSFTGSYTTTATVSTNPTLTVEFNLMNTGGCDNLLVTRAVDNGSPVCGSLTNALTKAINSSSAITISFAPTLTLLTIESELPIITSSARLVIGTEQNCQMGSGRGIPSVEIRAGSTFNSTQAAFRLANNATLQGLKITDFSGYALEITGANNIVRCSWLGTANGVTALPNEGGIYIHGSNAVNNLIEGSLISGNSGWAILVENAGVNNRLYDNWIGYRTNGVDVLPNHFGIKVANGQLALRYNNRIYV
jgi:subtilisin-like proprotein convertase family protein